MVKDYNEELKIKASALAGVICGRLYPDAVPGYVWRDVYEQCEQAMGEFARDVTDFAINKLIAPVEVKS